LVDPELARRERARLEGKAYLREVLDEDVFDVAALRHALESQTPPAEETLRHRPWWPDAVAFSKRRLVPAALLCSLLANGLFVAHVVARRGEEATQVAVRMVTLTASTAESEPPAAREVSTTLPVTKTAVERKVISLILSAPTRKLPRTFIDSTTGLVKNNVQVVCRKSKQRQRSFLCAVRLPADGSSKALYVRYRTDEKGRGAFKWYGYKRS
jgi:hypothetical protein